MQKNKKDIGKITAYVLGSLTVLSSIFIFFNSDNGNINKLWGLLPLTLGITILLLNRFKKIN